MALVTAEECLGWVGGSCTRPTVVAEARKALRDGQPRLVCLDPDPEARRRPGLRVFPMTCHSGGSVEIHIQPVLPAPRLLVYGVAPVARAIARLGKAMDFVVYAVDADADANAFPGVDVFVSGPAELRLERTGASVYAVVATQGQWDEDALVSALAHDPSYVAVVASPRRFAQMRETLESRVGAPALARVRNPAGLDLGGVTPEEIALSILAEMVKLRRAAGAEAGERPEPPAAETARDPVCGMDVTVGESPHHARHAGRDYHFCCAGCRERFVADPERYLAASPAR
jgi:xanthine dehydrogenase accessory factor